eukprot:scaffold584960_cov47-Prasinocladus_malaysianus.AAC.1
MENAVEKLNWQSITSTGSDWNNCLTQLVGLPDVQSLEAFYDWLDWNGQADRLVYWNGRKTVVMMQKQQAGGTRKTKGRATRRSFKSKDAFILSLVKLRTGLSDRVLATWTGIHRGCVSRIVTTWSAFMDAFFNSEFPIPTSADLKDRISSEWKHVYGTNMVRYVPDATEFRMQQPASRKAARTCFSDYKNCHTAKLLAAICPLGAYVGCSEAYPGRISDHELFLASKLCEVIQPGDCIPADKGFDQIQPSVAARGGRIVAPHRRAKGVKTYTSTERDENEGIANLRIHIERHFCRVANWGIFTQKKQKIVSIDMIDKIFNVVSHMCNFQCPLYKETFNASDSDSDEEGS